MSLLEDIADFFVATYIIVNIIFLPAAIYAGYNQCRMYLEKYNIEYLEENSDDDNDD